MFDTGSAGLDAIGRFERWTIDPRTRRTARLVIDGTAQEFPPIDGRRFGQPHRYAYTVSVPRNGDTQLFGASTIHKYDMQTGQRRVHDFGGDRVPGEFVFVPAGAHADEDEGWLLGLVIDRTGDATDFTILDACRFEAPPVATVRLPHRIPPGFHGNWFPAA